MRTGVAEEDIHFDIKFAFMRLIGSEGEDVADGVGGSC
jgi:hypothetical protein